MAKSKTTKAPAKEATPAEEPFLSYNRVSLGGRLVADPELRYTPTGKALCRMRVATNDTREAQFHDVVAWEETAEKAAESLSKGAAVVIEGRLQTRSWEAQDGTRRRATEVVADFLDPVQAQRA
jgi:single-strand DNA-binding protein